MCFDAQVSDRALIHRVLDGDPKAADLFVARFTRLVWWILIHQLRLTPESAEEVYQDVFVHLWGDDYRRLRNWSGEGDFAAYLAPIVRHRGLDCIRRGNARREQPLPGIEEESGREPIDDRPGPEELARLEEQRRQLEQAVASLGEQDRKLYELRFVGEQSYREIALACGITINNAGVRLNRLVERLRAAVVEPRTPKPPNTGDAVRSPGAGPSIK
jgi:RNA polymerase sigma factor (sigma-70 family)